MPSFIQRITNFIRGTRAGSATTTIDLTPAPPMPTAELQRFAVERDRTAIIQIVRRMVDEDPRAARLVADLARDATRGGFSVKVQRGNGSARANAEAAALIERLGLAEAVMDWAKFAFKEGDAFLEIGVDANNDIVAVTRKPVLQMHRQSDDRDQFPDPTRAYWWADELWMGMDAPRDAVWFADWQILHVRWDHDSAQRYGRPLFASARKQWKRVDEGETDMAVRRKTRAGLKYNHKFPDGTAPDVIETYKEQNKDALGNPTAAISDFFGTTDITAIEGDGRLAEIGDVKHHLATWGLASPLPLSLLGYGEDLNRDVLDDQKKQYDRALDGVCLWIDKEIIQPLIELQWLLKGIWPASLTYQITRPSRNPITPADLASAGDAAQKLKETGVIADVLLLRFLAQIIPNLDPEEAMQLLQQQQEEQAARQPAPQPQVLPGSNQGNQPPGQGDQGQQGDGQPSGEGQQQ